MPMKILVIDRMHVIRVENNIPEDLNFTNTVGGGIGDDRELMLGIPDPVNPAWLYDTD